MWNKKNKFSSVKEVVLNNVGMTEEEFFDETKYQITNLDKAAQVIASALARNEPIKVMGDYDADGVTSTTILNSLLAKLKYDTGSTSEVSVRLPRRFSEGYGLSMKVIEETQKGLLITIDNGITAIEQIKKAKEKGLTVIVLDHHLLNDKEEVPEADVVVDPAVFDTKTFGSYCGAGIAFKLCELMTNDDKFIDSMAGFAAIGTVADVMPMIKENRVIVNRGLKAIREGMRNNNIPSGLRALIETAEIYKIDEYVIGFKIGPMINACGRMYDEGANIPFELFTSKKPYTTLLKEAGRLIKINDERKVAVANGMKYAREYMADNMLYGNFPLVINGEVNIHEGVAGIIAGNLSEEFKTPSVVLCEATKEIDGKEEKILKGSGRSYGEVHLKDCFDKASSFLLGYGGHKAAGGLSLLKENFYDFCDAIETIMADLKPEIIDTDEVEFDLEIEACEIKKYSEELKKYAPYDSECNKKPVFKINGIKLSPRNGKFCTYMGEGGQHVKLFSNEYSLIAFGKAEEYKDENMPLIIDVVGVVSENVFRNIVETQIEISDFKSAETDKTTSLQSLLAERMKLF